MGLLTFIVKKVVPIPRILDCESFAFVGAHPDDIEVGCGSTVAKLTEMGKKVCFIVATDGRYGSMDIDVKKDDLIKLRQAEAINAAQILGVNDVRFLNFPDGGDYETRDLADKIAIELAQFKPDMVFAIDNHVKSEIHPDHLKAGRATEIALLKCAFPLMMKDLNINEVAQPKGIAYYYTDKPNSYVYISKYIDKKFQSLKAHKSQFDADDTTREMYKYIKLGLKANAIRYGIRKLHRYADAYRVLSISHLHCLPDASKF